MANPEMQNIPGMGPMTDTLEFVKKLWGGMGLPGTQGGATPSAMPGMHFGGMQMPGMVMPTLSVEEINKRIADLRAVESWLTLNMNMLRGTIQALEVQAATLSALNAMGQSVSATMKAAGLDPAQAASAAGSAAGSGENGGHGANDSGGGGSSSGAQAQADVTNMAAPLVNAAAWWNMLQDQFQQAVNTAMTAETPAAQRAAAGDKPRAKSGTSARKGKPAKE